VFSLPFAPSTFLVSAVAMVASKGAPAVPRDTKVTRYERARIIGSRALQVSMGAPVLIEVPERFEGPNPVGISMAEYELGLIPITVRRAVATERKRAYATTANAGPAERGKQPAKRERE
jgi:DNA-directed RNA polymerase subunit K